MKLVTYLFIFVTLLTCGCSSPISRKELQQEAIVNCSNEVLLRMLRKASVPFGCLPGTRAPWNRAQGDQPSLPSSASAQKRGQKIRSKSEVITLEEEVERAPQKKDCLDPKSCGSIIKTTVPENYFVFTLTEESEVCPEGYAYSPLVKGCVPKQLSSPQRQREEYFQSNLESLNPRKCKNGYVFDFEQVRCIKNKKIFSVGHKKIVEIRPEQRFIDHQNCPKGTIYVPEVDLCLPIKTKPSAIIQQNMEPVAIPVKHGEKCPKNSVFNPEIGHCMFIVTPSTKTEQMPQPLPLVSDSEPQADEATQSEAGRPKCKKGTEYIPKINQCVPIKSEAPRGDDSVSLLEDPVPQSSPDPFRLVLAPLTAAQIGKSKCQPGTVYVSEIDICLEPIS